MKSMILASVVFLAGCGGEPVAYETPCGMLVIDTTYKPEPDDLARLEERAVRHGAITCERLRDATLFNRDEIAWQNNAARGTAGETMNGPMSGRGRIVIGSVRPKNPLTATAYSHELFHLMHPEWLTWDSSEDHKGWGTSAEIKAGAEIRIIPETGLSVFATISLINEIPEP